MLITVEDLRSLTVDQLWDLHEEVVAILTDKLVVEKRALEDRMRRLTAVEPFSEKARRRRVG